MSDKKEMTVPTSPVLHTKLLSAPCLCTEELKHIGADGKQSNHKEDKEIIANSKKQINQQAIKKWNHHLNNQMNEGSVMGCDVKAGHKKLNTISMTELYDTVYPPRIPIVDGFLYGGIYLFVGAPKVGKSFFMAQLAYHVAMSISL